MNQKEKRKLLKQKDEKPRLFTEKEVMDFTQAVITSYIASSLITLRDKFEFGKGRMERFLASESAHAQAIKNGHVTSKEILNQIKIETGFDLQEFIENRYREMEGDDHPTLSAPGENSR